MEIMMSVRIIIDSASDLTKEQADKLGLDFLPLKTIFGTEEYLDGITLSHQQFYEKLIESDCMPTTSQIPPHDFEQLYADVKEKKTQQLSSHFPPGFPVLFRVPILHWMVMKIVLRSLTAKMYVLANRFL